MSGKKQCNLLDQRNPCYTLRLQILAQSFLKSINVLNFRSDLKVCHVGLKTRSLGQMKNTVFTLLAQSGKVFLFWQWWYTFGHSKMRKSVMQFFFFKHHNNQAFVNPSSWSIQVRSVSVNFTDYNVSILPEFVIQDHHGPSCIWGNDEILSVPYKKN